MNSNIVLFSLLEMGLSLLVGIVILFMCFRLIARISRQSFHMEQKGGFNVAFSILAASAIFAVGYLMESIFGPVADTFRTLSNNQEMGTGEVLLITLGYMIAFFILAGVIAYIIVLLSMKIFMWFTKDVDEFEEIRNNNIGVGIIVAAIIVVMAILLKDGLENLIHTLIPYPQLPKS